MALSDKPLMSRKRWTVEGAAIVVAWVAVCAIGAAAVLVFADGIWMAVGLTLVAFLFSPLLEAPFSFTRNEYGKYREEWEQANRAQGDSGGSRRS